MNAAFLLVTTAWFTGQGLAPAPAMKAAPVPAAAAAAPGAPIIASGGGSCSNCGSSSYAPASSDACCDSGHGGRLRGLLSGLFNRGGSCGCETQTCDTGCGRSHGHVRRNWTWSQPSCNTCATSTCDTGCSSGCKLFGGGGRLKGLFSRGHGSDCGCSGDCNTCGSSSTPYVSGSTASPGMMSPTPAPNTGEMINTPPKKMPANPAPLAPVAPPAKTGAINVPAAPLAPASPSVEVAPPAVPSIDSDRREPF